MRRADFKRILLSAIYEKEMALFAKDLSNASREEVAGHGRFLDRAHAVKRGLLYGETGSLLTGLSE